MGSGGGRRHTPHVEPGGAAFPLQSEEPEPCRQRGLASVGGLPLEVSQTARHTSGSCPPGGPRSADPPTMSFALTLTDWFLTGLARLMSGPQVRWIDCQPDTCQRVYFANHTSHIDLVLVRTALPPACREVTRPVAAHDYWSQGWLRPHLAKAFNAMLIDRKSVKVHQSPIDLMLAEMGDRYSVIIFPEGGRSDGQRVGEFKSGLYYLGKKRPDIELVPVHLHNMHRVLPRDEYLPIPLLATVTFGPPIWLEQDETKNDFLARARQAVLRLAPREDE